MGRSEAVSTMVGQEWKKIPSQFSYQARATKLKLARHGAQLAVLTILHLLRPGPRTGQQLAEQIFTPCNAHRLASCKMQENLAELGKDNSA